ncbi:autotransporter protein [Yersinia pseudotuberculosis]|uniref:autotransporter adhesin YapJ n=5 Tax=Yersinia pseudotuberculosis complex TaxID=1649845 RepID=UPI00061C0464|nr:autotransporter adhesin YapJ [Yersinia pseudotuberculosis]CNI68248.1 autotransporter protein [Yersinia pseudotuberculosis]
MHIQFREPISTSPAQPDAGHRHLFSCAPAAAINPITLAIIVAFSALVLPQTARASCNSSGVGTYVCEGENHAGIILSGTDIAVETQPGFSITEPGGADPALSLIGSGAISYLDTNRSALDTTGADSLYIQNDTSMAGQSTSINIQSNSSIGSGININNRSGADAAIQIDLSGTLSGNQNGSAALSIHSSAEGNSAFILNLDALSGSMGLQSYNDSRNGIATTNINIANDINVEYSGASINNTGNGETSIINFNSKNITTEFDGLNVYNTNYAGAAITNINIDGDIRSANSQAATFYNSAYEGPSSLRLRANHVTGEYAGLYISNDSRKSSAITDILLTGDLTSTSGAGLVFNSYVEEDDIGASIKLNNIYSYYEALSLSANTLNGDMQFDLDISGDIVNEYGTGILMMGMASEGNSTIIINANNINSGSQSLRVNNYSHLGTAVSDITATGHLVSEQGVGAIFSTYVSQGDAIAVINLNDITAAGSSVEIDTIASEGNSTTYLTVVGQINASNGEGITLISQATDGSTLVNIDVNNIASEYDAIYLHNSVTGVDNGTSTIDLITRGALVSQQGYGINIETNTADTYVTVGGLVHGGNGTAIGIHRLENVQTSATLELQSGYALEGVTQALVFTGSYAEINDAALDLANSHLVLGGTGDAVFDLTRIDNREEAILDGDPNRITGFGTLTKTNNSIWTLTGSNMADGDANAFLSANIAGGILVLDNATLGLTPATGALTGATVNRLSAADIAADPTLVATETGALTLAEGGALSSLGDSVLSGNLISAGGILLSNHYTGGNGAATDDRLTVTGTYLGENNGSGEGAWLALDTVLGDDDSATDRLMINGDATGTTSVRVNNAGGLGDKTLNGINLITVDGLAQDDTFLLAGDYVTTDGYQAVVGGAYAYTLQADGEAATEGRNWYLSSELMLTEGVRYQAGVPLYEQYPQVLAALNTLPTLQQRVGNRYGAPGALAELNFDDNQWAWGRIEGSHQVTDPARSTSGSQREIDVWKLQTGIDVPLYQSQGGSLLTGGVNFTYGKAKADIHSFFGDGRINSAGYGLGTSLTWYGNNGVYVDGQLQTMWFDSDLSSRTAGHAVASGNNGRGYTSAIEAGKGYALGNGLSLTPQMQVTYSRVDFDTFRDPFDSEVSLQEGDSLRGRLGVSLDKETTWSAKDGTTRRSHIYSHLDLHNEFLNGSKVQVSGVEFATRDERQSVGLGAGGTYEWQNGRYAVYGNVNLLGATRNVSDNYAVGGTIGARVSW